MCLLDYIGCILYPFVILNFPCSYPDLLTNTTEIALFVVYSLNIEWTRESGRFEENQPRPDGTTPRIRDSNGKLQKNCFICKKLGHIARECRDNPDTRLRPPTHYDDRRDRDFLPPSYRDRLPPRPRSRSRTPPKYSFHTARHRERNNYDEDRDRRRSRERDSHRRSSRGGAN